MGDMKVNDVKATLHQLGGTPDYEAKVKGGKAADNYVLDDSGTIDVTDVGGNNRITANPGKGYASVFRLQGNGNNVLDLKGAGWQSDKAKQPGFQRFTNTNTNSSIEVEGAGQVNFDKPEKKAAFKPDPLEEKFMRELQKLNNLSQSLGYPQTPAHKIEELRKQIYGETKK